MGFTRTKLTILLLTRSLKDLSATPEHIEEPTSEVTHNLVITETKLKLSRVKKTNATSRKYEISKLNSTDVQKEFFLELRNRFSCLKIEETEDNEEKETDRRTEVDSNIEQCWKSVKETFNETA